MNQTPMLEARGLTKRHGGHPALDDVGFSVRAGTVTGLLGPDGAGKSSTMRLFMGLDRPSAGQALIDGRPIADWPEPGRKVGAVLSSRCAHPGRTALDGLRWIAILLGVPDQACHDALERAGLSDYAEARAGQFSLGMRQRLGVAQALLGDPEVLLLDEPMNGMNAGGVAWLRDLLGELRAEGRTVLVASHLLREIEGLVDDLVLLTDGRVTGSGSMADYLDRSRREAVQVRCADVHGLVSAVRAAGGQIQGVVQDRWVTVVGLDAGEVDRIARDRGLTIEETSTARDPELLLDAVAGDTSDMAGGAAR